jgi:hypothetical protein
MPIVEKIQYGGISNKFDLAVEVSGLTITVRNGAIRDSGEDRTLQNDQDFVVAPDSLEVLQVTGWLAIDTETSAVVVLVDEMLPGENRFDFESSSYRPLHALYGVLVPAGATSLDDVDVYVTKMVEGTVEE